MHQAEAVAASNKVSIPASIIRVVERCIKARQRCAAWFKKTDVRNDYSDEGHARFIEVLQEVLETLKPCVKTESSKCKYHSKLRAPITDHFCSKEEEISVQG